MKLTVDILEDFINSLSLSGTVKSFQNDATDLTTTLFVDNIYHARKGMLLNIDGNEYTIFSTSQGISITVEGLLSEAENYTVPNPFYFHGTPVKTNADHISGATSSAKVPMVYLYEILKERDLRVNSNIRRESDIRLFFLDSANFEDWNTDEHYSNRLLGLNNLVDTFIESARNYDCCFYLYDTDFTRINHVNWGVYQDNKGHMKKIFDDDLTGVELSFTLPLVNCK